ncbi:MAG: magnesium transporter [Verrucomicrobia bacterium]|jgi:magnesium transporter|nr:magnesium transporter [Verrucomicrobiota bacterium]
MKHDQHLDEPISRYARRDFTALKQHLTVAEALDALRHQELGERIVYLYVVDECDQLVGVLPVRRLLMAKLDRKLTEVMISQVVALPHGASVLDACELFAMHRFLALPVVDGEQKLVGVVDVNLFTEEIFDFTERERMNEVFEAVGFRVSAVREAKPWLAFRYRFPWLLATVASGTVCALLAGAFEATLAQSLVLTFFLTLVLGLGESVSVQSMTVTIRALHARRPTWGWFGRALGREIPTALLLGVGCGLLVGVVVWLWRGSVTAAAVVGGSIVGAMAFACVWGLSVPALLHALRLDPKIAAGPMTLAVTDISTLLIYFSAAAWLL